MSGRWRKRFMAPGYALVISFILVVILGFALNDQIRISFTMPNGENIHVVVKAAADGTELTDVQLGGSQEITVPLNRYEKIQICLPKGWRLPKEWLPTNAQLPEIWLPEIWLLVDEIASYSAGTGTTVPEVSNLPCWYRAPGNDAQGEIIDVTLTRRGVGR